MDMRYHPARVVLALSLVFSSSLAARADYISQTLGSAGPSNYAVLSIGGGDVHMNGPGTTTGNVGITSAGTLHLDSSNGNPPVAVVGNVYLGDTASITHPSQVNGSIFTNQNAKLNQATNDARTASNTFANLSPTQTVPGGAVTGNTIINGTSGMNVVDLKGINLNHATLTLNGPAGSQFIINDSGGFVLNGSQIKLTGGVTANDVVINVPHLSTLHASGGSSQGVPNSQINGIVLAPWSNVGFAPVQINGELIAGGKNIQLVSGSRVNSPPTNVVPAPPSLVLFGLGGLCLPLVLRKARRRRTVLASC
jgi:choice-of-anchor A domain-containing protein